MKSSHFTRASPTKRADPPPYKHPFRARAILSKLIKQPIKLLRQHARVLFAARKGVLTCLIHFGPHLCLYHRCALRIKVRISVNVWLRKIACEPASWCQREMSTYFWYGKIRAGIIFTNIFILTFSINIFKNGCGGSYSSHQKVQKWPLDWLLIDIARELTLIPNWS